MDLEKFRVLLIVAFTDFGQVIFEDTKKNKKKTLNPPPNILLQNGFVSNFVYIGFSNPFFGVEGENGTNLSQNFAIF